MQNPKSQILQLFLLPLVLSAGPLYAVPRISEFVAQNTYSLLDEDGDSEDWIEIENTAGTPVSLAGWYLTDNPENLTKWQIPAVTLDPNGYLVIFASNKDRVDPAANLHTNFTLQAEGEFVALVEPDGTTIASSYDPPPQFRDISYGVGTASASIITIPIDKGTNASYFVAETDPGADNWRVPSYDDSAWPTAGLAFGWDTSPPYLELLGEGGNLEEAARGKNASVYVRAPFTIEDPSSVLRMVLDLNWEDGVVGYLNGEEILSENAPSPLLWDSNATGSHNDSLAIIPDTYEIDFAGKLVSGTNILAFQVMNTAASGSDLLLLPKLTMEQKDSAAGEAEAFFEEPTPGAPNSIGKLAPAYVTVDQPTQSFASGSIEVTLTADVPEATIRYTLDGSEPTDEIGEASEVYTTPLTFTENTRIRARAYLPGSLPGPIRTEAYFRLEEDAAAATSNLPFVLISSFGNGAPLDTGSTSRRPMIMAIFEPKDTGDGTMVASMLNPPDLVTRCGIRKRGSSSGGWPKYQMSVEAWGEADFEEKTIEPFGMAGDDDWILGTFYQFDRALIRNPFIYEISRQIGRFAARTKHVELWNNNRGDIGGNDYFGVYTVMEKLDRSNDRIDVASLNETITEEPDITGGYILKKDRPDPGEPTLNVRGMGSLVHVYPDGSADRNRPDAFFITSAQKSWLQNHMNEIDAALAEDDGINPDTGLHFSDYIDVSSFVDHVILNAFGMNVDWGRLSAWMYKDRGGKLNGGPIWDFDRNMGSEDGRDANPESWDGTGDSSKTWYDSRYPWYGEVLGYSARTDDGPPRFNSTRPDVLQMWIDRWFSLRKDVLSIENINAVVDSLANPLTEAAERNFERWRAVAPNGGRYSEIGGRTWASEVSHMRGWLKLKAEFIDSQFPEEPVFSTQGGSVPVGTTLAFNFQEGTVYFTTDGSDPRASGGLVSQSAIQFEGGAVDSTLVPMDAPVGYFIPSDGSLGLTWTQADFDGSSWTQAATGVGWETAGGTLESVIKTNISDQLRNVNAGAYFRWEFDFNNADAVNGLTLNVQCDDGFVAYLNGVQIAAINAPDPVSWDSKSDGTTPDNDVVEGAVIDVSEHKDALRNGTNVLAIHAMNSSEGGSDFLIRAGLDVNETVVPQPIVLNESQTITARVKNGEFWGAPVSYSFAVGTTPATAANLMVSEIMYHPSDPSAAEIAAGFTDKDQFEFIEFVNISNDTIDLSGVKFDAGATFTFPGGLLLAAGARTVVVSDRAAFLMRYGAGMESIVAGQFGAETNLANSGERILLLAVDSSILKEFTYNDKAPWPEAADGDGFSLVLISPQSAPDHNMAENWTIGVTGGTPGAGENTTTFVGDPDADNDNDGLSAFAEYALGTLESDSSSGPGVIQVRVDGGGDLRLTFPKNTAAGDVIYTVEISTNLSEWTSGELVSLVEEIPTEAGRSEVTYQSAMPDATEVYMRLRMTQKQ